MKFKEGDKVVVVKAHDKREYYHGGDTSEVALKSKGKVISVNDKAIRVELKKGFTWNFHPTEIQLAGQTSPAEQLGKLPQPYLFRLASQMPLFLINDKMYVLDGSHDNLKSNFFQTSSDDGLIKRRLTESATLSQLEELTQAHYAKDFDKTTRKYLQEAVEERSQIGADDRYKLVDFIVNEVFPYFRRNGEVDARLGKLLGVKSSDTKKEIETDKTPKAEKEDPFISKLIDRIEKESFQSGEGKQKKTKLDVLLGYDLRWDVTDFSQDYTPDSLLGKVLAGRNVAVVDNVVYNLVWTNSQDHKRVLNIDGKNFALVSPRSLEEVKARYDFALSKQVRSNALRNKLAQDTQLQALAQRNVNLSSLVKKKEYREGDFGFIKDDDSWDEHSYWVFLQVPKHVLKMPDDYNLEDDDDIYDDEGRKKSKRNDRYYLFDKVRVAVRVFANDSGKISYDNIPVTVEEYGHPFATSGDSFGDICLGKYKPGKLNHLKRGEAVARLLADTRTTLLSGYTRGNTGAAHILEDFEDSRITLSEARRRNIPVTNIHLGRRKR